MQNIPIPGRAGAEVAWGRAEEEAVVMARGVELLDDEGDGVAPAAAAGASNSSRVT